MARSPNRRFFRLTWPGSTALAGMLLAGTSWPLGSPAAKVEYLHPRNHVRALSDRYCAAYVVWHTLTWYGQKPDIDDVVRQLGLNAKDKADIADIVAVLRSRGLECEAVKLRASDLKRIQRMCIPYLQLRGGCPDGHFVVLIPTESGQGVVVDGIASPHTIDLAGLGMAVSKGIWDGTCVVVRRPIGSRWLVVPGALALALAVGVVLCLYLRRTNKKRMEVMPMR